MENNYFGRSSKPRKHYTKEENLSFQNDIFNIYLNEFENNPTTHPGALLLDSSLITQTSLKSYSVKVIECGDYYYVYKFESIRCKTDKNILRYKDKDIDINYELIKYEAKEKINKINNNEIEEIKENKKIIIKKENREIKNKEIELKNINRSKYKLQQLIKTNEKEFRTFITLTFKDEITTITESSKKFNIFKTMIKRVKTDFKYICVPEFQKNGRVHYHLLTNISYDDLKLINENKNYNILLNNFKSKSYKLFYSSYKDHRQIFFFNQRRDTQTQITSAPSSNDFGVCLRYVNNKLQNTKKTYNYKSKSIKIFKTIKYWNFGYSNVICIDNINIVGYLTKYLSKDIDNRLFGFRSYLYSQNLKSPSITYLDLSKGEDLLMYLYMGTNSEEIYNSIYSDTFGQPIYFTEYKKKLCIEE